MSDLFDDFFEQKPSYKYYVGIDNGSTGLIAIIKPSGEVYVNNIPVKEELNYTKAKQYVTRIDCVRLKDLLSRHTGKDRPLFAVMERPMVNPKRFKQSLSGIRVFEAMLIVIEELEIPFQIIDSRKWQKELLPSGLAGPELKRASLSVGNRLFPQFSTFKHPDRDGLLMAEYARRAGL